MIFVAETNGETLVFAEEVEEGGGETVFVAAEEGAAGEATRDFDRPMNSTWCRP